MMSSSPISPGLRAKRSLQAIDPNLEASVRAAVPKAIGTDNNAYTEYQNPDVAPLNLEEVRDVPLGFLLTLINSQYEYVFRHGKMRVTPMGLMECKECSEPLRSCSCDHDDWCKSTRVEAAYVINTILKKNGHRPNNLEPIF